MKEATTGDTAAPKRRLSTAVLALATLVAVAASVLGVGLLVASDAPFDRAFAAQHGAHLAVTVDPTGAGATPQTPRVTPSMLRSTAELPVVAAAAGPFVTATVPVHVGDGDSGFALGLLTVAGRGDPTAPVDALTLTSGRWAQQPGEIVLDPRELPLNVGDRFLGMRLTADIGGGRTTLTIVGLGRSVTHTANAWATGDTVAALAGASPQFQMLYRFADATTPEALRRDADAIAAALPDGAIAGAASYLATRQALTANAAAFVPFVTAFGALAVVLSVLVIGIVVGGVMGAARRRIGIMKAIGFTPGQVTRVFTVRTLLPALAAITVGSVAAMLAARPILAEMDDTYGGATGSIPLWVALTVSGGVLLLITAATLTPALRMSRQPAAALLHPGRRRSPSPAGRWMQRLLGRSRLPRPVGLGLAAPLRRPARSLALAATILVAAACLSFAGGLLASLTSVQQSRNPLTGGEVQVRPAFASPESMAAGGLPSTPAFADAEAVHQALVDTPGAAKVFGTTVATVVVSGVAGGTEVVGIAGDSTFTHHQMVAGRWLSGADGEAVLPTTALRARGMTVGDRLTLSAGSLSTTVTVVGEVFDLSHDGMRVYTTAGTLGRLRLDTTPGEFSVLLQPGTDIDSYLDGLAPILDRDGAEAARARDGSSDVLGVMNAVTALLATMLLVVAAIGVLGTAMLEIRDRARDLGVFKALGMSPRHIVAMTLTAVGSTGLVAGLIGVPVGVALHHIVVPRMGATGGAVLTPGQVQVYGAPMIAALLLGGLVLAVLGGLGPALAAARARGAVALRAE